LKIGLSFTAKRDLVDSPSPGGSALDDASPDDAEEEFDSLDTMRAIALAIASHGHEVELLPDDPASLERLLRGPRPDFIFNLAEGRGAFRSREAWMPALFEKLGLPYSGSDPLTLAVTLDKDVAKRLVAAAGVLTPRSAVIHPGAAPPAELSALAGPLVVKPACEGSSKGVRATSLVADPDEALVHARAMLRDYAQPVLVEEYIHGDELTVGLVGGVDPNLLGIMRIVPRLETGADPFLYSLEVKRDWRRRVTYECPAAIGPEATRAVAAAARTAWRALGCRDLSRFDFRLRDGIPYFLEVNPLPGLSPETGDLVILARSVGIDHRQLIGRILAAAFTRLGLPSGA
jgi:D-alanine-D-alanine ligase